MTRRLTITSLLICLAVSISACAGATAIPDTPTLTPIPPTETPAASPTATIIPTETLTPVPTSPPIPSFVMLTLATDAFCRKGPGVQYADLGSASAGEVVQADARSDTVPRWWWVVRNAGGHCWISDTTVQPNAQAELLPIQPPEYALPQTPPDLWADRVCNPKKGGFAVTLNWTPSSTATGYYVYANGELIQDIKKATRTSYVIKLEMNQAVTYGMQAYNDVGSGDLILFNDAGCP